MEGFKTAAGISGFFSSVDVLMMGSVPSNLDHLSPCLTLYNSISILKGVMLNLLCEGSI